ncbi:phospho-sugar mutase [Lacticaseibacillus zeae]|uniref:Phosphoglucomutase n=1 Tax=Lacticaseibacillus zeae subsp. silagei TaxID=3068307 RepID=A0ABD7ZB61_LACZE|nr:MULTISPECIES: phospho-sugar mutase [Lacticaseibacillus]MDE3314810.1 phospho-sugar mutase [Lacticaseibacillus zeae]OFS00091.1 phosphoglucomutase [Lactobacillus sp. HMSC068F07]WLV84417.1 phospho-sugar mutase [Lacticaseibacillus sp. NCIMB 15475]WLV87173.1 phospho-sugar mutase [Lacticaseibacillus sp. NCIMB 15474]
MSYRDTYQQWVDEPTLDPELKADLKKMADDETTKEEAFAAPMAFGTAGMRGVLGAGIGRMNIYTVRQATEGLARFMDTLTDETKARGVAISYDSRYMSQEFAYQSAGVLGAHGIKSYVFDQLRPTPELSFAVRHLKTYAGIMITASHNPKQYNGYKIYGPDGGQMPPEESDKITKYARSASDLFAIKALNVHELRAKDLMQPIGEDVDEAYYAEVATVTINPDLVHTVGKNMSLVYSPLHGTGRIPAQMVLRNAGFENFRLVPEQSIADPEFATTPFPNPEFAQVFDLPIALGKKIGADVLIATDPDADRLGTAVKVGDHYQLLTGNQIASVLLHYILEARKQAGTLPKNGAVVKSIVSTELATAIAKDYGVDMINVLTGFKFIGDQIKHFQATGEHEFLFGFEESYGYLIKPFVRDKDAIQSTVLLAEVAAYYQSQGKTLWDGVQELYKKYGYYAEKTVGVDFEGVDGPKQMANLMTKFREEQPDDFGGVKIAKVEDFLSQEAKSADGTVEKLTMPSSNVLKYILEDGTWIAIRPSGTEPKVKFYVGTKAETDAKAQEKLEAFEKALNDFREEA